MMIEHDWSRIDAIDITDEMVFNYDPSIDAEPDSYHECAYDPAEAIA